MHSVCQKCGMKIYLGDHKLCSVCYGVADRGDDQSHDQESIGAAPDRERLVVVTYASDTCGDVPVAILRGVTAPEVNRELDRAGVDDLCADEAVFIDLTQVCEGPVEVVKRLAETWREDNEDI